ncbi:LPS export ABC transporter periplasmic protein LptC [Hydrogenophaga atypica]|uniref:LPS export ABC transporter periplasmic protein LptC n=1 Tax=Hydrogenophaga atypica TaxID=249409 RepID=A0ABW2QDM8_9BURK
MNTVAAAPWGRQLRRGWDRLSIYLPVVLMGLLALGSYWLLRATPEPELTSIERPPQHEPDYFMRGFAVRSFAPDGGLRSEVKGTEARHYPDTDSTEIDQARIRTQPPGSTLTTARADRVTSNADQTEYVLRGNAVVVREAAGANRPRLEFNGEHLRVLTGERRVTSEQPVVLLRGRDQIRANTLDFREATGVALLQGRVQATLQARP